ncbi:hypothetical protein F1C58_16415 (plasmid) [Glaciihabitans sp. INWT7]|uniref:hypothetical protein n=1 Tax=Glaciihabitans sp. INWT7 TaxID=2596912 RepID=UPI001627D18F|nr:hypothetical protein [Glaciihabitans sp. INWT7]QNE48642.1 hypothetical protein F1C58_16415 [Glaciihabitans sp. INWT7]
MFHVTDVEVRVVPVATRIPFRYGITELTSAPHAVVSLQLTSGAGTSRGMSAENLPPKWFTKDPDSSLDDDLADMVRVVLSAARAAEGLAGASPFDWWMRLQALQEEWGRAAGLPPLLVGLGTSLMERAMIDAWCRLTAIPFGTALRADALGVDLGALHPELAGTAPSRYLPARGRRSLAIRHTIGLADPVPLAPRVLDDGLPETAEDAVGAYGLDHLKIKTQGDVARDVIRLAEILEMIEATRRPFAVTVDGNESFYSSEDFVLWWQQLAAAPGIGSFLAEALIAIEQPFHRSMALDPTLADMFTSHPELPMLIIDESDGEPDSIRRAMDLGYAGGTYKGCKGVFRGVANACLVNARFGDRTTILTAEDLTTLPPLALLQDFAVVSALGLTHIERNGHYFFGTVAQIAPRVDELLLESHPDLFERSSDGRAQLAILHGEVAIGTVVDAPFGCAPEFDLAGLPELV